MRSREQVVWDFVQSWLAKAEGDLRAAETLLASLGGHGEVVGFHSQQAAEKFMKAYLVRHQIEFPKTHDLALLSGLTYPFGTYTANHIKGGQYGAGNDQARADPKRCRRGFDPVVCRAHRGTANRTP